MSGFFDPTKGIWKGLGKLADVLIVSVSFAAFSLPVVTMGASVTAGYDATVHCIRGDDPRTFNRFFSTFKQELKNSLKATATFGLFTALLIALVFFIRFHVAFEGPTAVILTALWFLVLLIPVGTCCWMFPLLSRFTFNTKGLVVTAFKLCFSNLPRTVLIVAAAVLEVFLIMWIIIPVVVMPGLTMLFWSVLMEPVFKKYMPGEQEDTEEV